MPPGPHAIVLTTFADSDGTQPLGVGCTEADLTAGSQICFDLTLGPAPDGGDISGGGCSMSPDDCPTGQYCTADGCVLGCKNDPDCVAMSTSGDGGATGLNHCDDTTHQCVECLVQTDCALGSVCTPSHVCAAGCNPDTGALCPGTQTCCNNICVDTDTDKLNCGGCGIACCTTNASAEQCTAASCGWTCNSGFMHCAAGNTGCDQNIFNVTHCGWLQQRVRLDEQQQRELPGWCLRVRLVQGRPRRLQHLGREHQRL